MGVTIDFVACEAAIAGKPPPTFDRVARSGAGQMWEWACPRTAGKVSAITDPGDLIFITELIVAIPVCECFP